MTDVLSRDALVAKARPATTTARIPGLGDVRVRGLTAAERAHIESLIVDVDPVTQTVRYDAEGAKRANLMLVAYGLLDGDDRQMFDPQNADDMRVLSDLDARVVEAIAREIRRLSGMTEATTAKKEPA